MKPNMVRGLCVLVSLWLALVTCYRLRKVKVKVNSGLLGVALTVCAHARVFLFFGKRWLSVDSFSVLRTFGLSIGPLVSVAFALDAC